MLPFGLLVVRAYMRVPLETSESRHIGALLILNRALNRAVGIYIYYMGVSENRGS